MQGRTSVVALLFFVFLPNFCPNFVCRSACPRGRAGLEAVVYREEYVELVSPRALALLVWRTNVYIATFIRRVGEIYLV